MDKDGILTEKPRKNLIILTRAAGKISGGRQVDDPNPATDISDALSGKDRPPGSSR